MLKLRNVLGIAAFSLMAGLPAAGRADAITYIFTSDHCTGGCGVSGTTSGGTVTITSNATGTLMFAVSLASGYQFINGGYDASFGFNLSGSGAILYSGINPAANFTIPGGNPQSPGALHMDGTGDFVFGLEGVGSGGSEPDGSSLSFTITRTGLTLASLIANADGQFFAADILSGTSGKTGGIDASVVSSSTGGPSGSGTVPEPSSTALALLGVALLGITFVRRRRGMRN